MHPVIWVGMRDAVNISYQRHIQVGHMDSTCRAKLFQLYVPRQCYLSGKRIGIHIQNVQGDPTGILHASKVEE